MISYLPHRRKAFQPAGGGGTTVYVEHDFTATTSGTLATVAPDIDEAGGGWTDGFGTTDFVFQGDGSGVESETTTGNQLSVVETLGREDVQTTLTYVIAIGAADDRWAGFSLRGDGGVPQTALQCLFDGIATDPDLTLYDGRPGDTADLKNWDLSALMTTPPDDGDTVDLVMRCSGNDITLYSISVNGASAEIINDTYTLTGAAATAHGAGSGKDFYGIYSNERFVSSAERFEYFKVESIP